MARSEIVNVAGVDVGRFYSESQHLQHVASLQSQIAIWDRIGRPDHLDFIRSTLGSNQTT